MKFKILLGSFLMLISMNLRAQEVEVYTGPRPGGLAGEKKNFELFGKGLLDYGFEGQLQATAQAIKINIGEPNKFHLPIYLLVGATNADLGSPALNKSTVMSLISPTGGATNLSTNFYVKLFASSTGITSLKISGLLSGKLITGRDSATNEPLAKPSGYFDGGLYFQTGAWTDEDGYKDGGIFWAQAKYTASYLAEEDLKTYFGPSVKGIPHGPRIEIGCFIQNRVNIKLSYYKAIGGKEIPTLNDSQFRLALDYSVFAN